MSVARHVTTITLGRRSPGRLDATYPHTPGAPSTCAYLVLLRVEIARFTRCAAPIGGYALPVAPGAGLRQPVRIEHPKNAAHRLVSVALILTLGSCDRSVDSR